MHNSWIPLRNWRSPESVPPLFVQCNFGPESYAVSVTDLSCIWSESLTRREIIRRALNENTTIDPTEASSQLQLLLDSISGPLKGRSGSVEIAPSTDGGLHLRATCPLPVPLHSLSWTFQLSPSATWNLRQEVILPLWLRSYQQEQQIDHLVRLLKDKDHVISKLLDQLDALNADMSTLFPSTAGLKAVRGSSKRDQAANLVPGLGIFDERGWRETLQGQHPDITQVYDGAIDLSRENAKAFETLRRDAEAGVHHQWLDKLGPLPAEAALPESVKSDVSRVSESQLASRFAQADGESTETEDEDAGEFQRQQTPQTRRDDPDPDAEEPVPLRRHSPAAATATLGASNANMDRAPKKLLGKIGRTVNEVDTHKVSDKQDQEPAAGSDQKPVKTSKLGRIGGVKKETDTDVVGATKQDGTAVPERAQQAPNLPSKEHNGATTASKSTSTPGPQILTAVSPEEATKEQILAQADKKRTDLKRRLENQAPIKKKRRF